MSVAQVNTSASTTALDTNSTQSPPNESPPAKNPTHGNPPGTSANWNEIGFSCLTISDNGVLEEKFITTDEIKKIKPGPSSKPMVIFLPRIMEIEKDDTLSKFLEESFSITRFFLTETGYESNGFFLNHSSTRNQSRKQSQTIVSKESVGCRFLVKELSSIPNSSLLLHVYETIYKAIYGERAKALEPDMPETDLVGVPKEPNTLLISGFREKYRNMDLVNTIFEIDGRPEQDSDGSFDDLLNKIEFAGKLETAQHDITIWLAKRKKKPQHPKAVKDSSPPKEKNEELESCKKDVYKLLTNLLLNIVHSDSKCILLSPHSLEYQKQDEPKQEKKPTTHQPNDSDRLKSQAEIPQRNLERNETHTSFSRGQQSQAASTKGHYCSEIKHVYHWFYLAFWRTTFSEEKSTREVLLCFDDADCPRLKKFIGAMLEKDYVAPLLLERVVEEVLQIYDAALWGFQPPVRSIEKRRKEHFLSERSTDDRLKIYLDMHELSRHLIHSRETLGAAETTLDAILTGDRDIVTRDGYDMIKFCHIFVKNLKLRAGAFVDRLENEVSLASHINNAKQLQQSQNDGREVAKFVGYASIVFLPGSFVSGFFSMTFFGFDTTSSFWGGNSRKCWIWFLITFPITIIGVLMLTYPKQTKELGNKLRIWGRNANGKVKTLSVPGITKRLGSQKKVTNGDLP